MITQDETTKHQCLSDGERILSLGCVSHNYLWFYRDAMEAALLAKEWDEADRFADALEKFIAVEPLPWSNFYIAWSRALAAAGRGDKKAVATAQVEPLWRYAEKNRLKMAARMFKAVQAAA